MLPPAVDTPREVEVRTHVLLRTHVLWKPLQPPYEGSYKVFECGKHTLGGRHKRISLDDPGRMHERRAGGGVQ